MNRFGAMVVGWPALVGATLMMSACGGSGGGSAPPTPTPPAANLPPAANAGSDQLVLVGATVNLSGSGTDADGTITTWAWTQASGTAVTLSATNNATPNFTAPAAAAALVFELSVTDNSGATRTDTVTVNVNAPPVANAGTDQTVNAGANVTLQGSATDANGTIAGYAWTQTAGPAVTMTGASTATLAFTAPATAAALSFQLTVTDNQQATHTDSIVVTVNSLSAPVIVRQPTSPHSVQDGSALMFLVATGENLNYEWHGNAFGTIVKTGPEPFLLRAGDLAPVGEHCYYVVVSNAAGSVTSDLGCITVEDLTENLDPSDPALEDRYLIADGYGGMLFGIAQTGAGLLTGSTLFGGDRTFINRFAEAAHSCLFGGSFLGTTLDGQVVPNNTLLPLGQHTISMLWNSCRETEDDIGLEGGMLVHYDFPNEFGVGSFTMRLSGLGHAFSTMNGTLEVTQTRGVNSLGRTVDDVDITIMDNFSSGFFRKTSGFYNTIEVLRTLNADGTAMVDTDVDFDLILTAFDGNGYAATVGQESGGIMHLIFDPVPGDNNIPAHRSNSMFGVLIGDLPNGAPSASVMLRPNGGSGTWGFSVEYPPDPEDP